MTRPDYCPVAQEPCQAMCSMSDVRCKIRDKKPQQRTWVGLTDKELEELSDAKLGSYDLCLEVEAKLKEKNNG